EVVGVHLLQRGIGFDSLALQSAPSSYSVLPLVIASDEASTEFHIVNPSPQASTGTIYLFSSSGEQVGYAVISLGAQAKWTARASDLLPSLPFQGYAVVSSDNDWYVASVLAGPGGIGGSNARPVQTALSTPSRLVLPILGGETTTVG